MPVWGLPSGTSSSTAETVTGCGTSQSELVKTNKVGAAPTWPSGVRSILTPAVGCDVSTTS